MKYFLSKKKKEQYQEKQLLTGFTIIELMITIFVILVGVAGVLVVIQHSIRAIAVSSDRFIAAYLAKEGMEIVRNIRDRNFLRGDLWDTGLSHGNFMADFDDPELNSYVVNTPLRINEDGFFNYGTGTPTRFKRKISLTHLTGPERISSVVKVYWIDRGIIHNVEVKEVLYNWR